ncbi:hypothetical protein Hypma_002716 [Hypsizygus marmoreus]|uniref:Uncharacterized protein n=1 Tax=Hypsizygus marmoreus TaxID=39966 RepID=A0A369J4R2_HYPMA|nr:hypothetical protein Hypma_002716 [Hypsizygus marmoreus]
MAQLTDKAEISETRKDMPKSKANKDYLPELCSTAQRKHSPPICLEVLAFLFTENDLLRWADENKYLLNSDENTRTSNVRSAIKDELPGPRRTRSFSIVWGPPRQRKAGTCIVVATNISEQDMARARDRERIEQFKKVLGVVEEPRWYTGPFPDYYC